MASDIDTLLCVLRNSSVENTTNEMIFELYEQIGKSKSYKYQDIVNVLQEKCTVDQFGGQVPNLRKLLLVLKKNPSQFVLVLQELQQGHKLKVYLLHLKTL